MVGGGGGDVCALGMGLIARHLRRVRYVRAVGGGRGRAIPRIIVFGRVSRRRRCLVVGWRSGRRLGAGGGTIFIIIIRVIVTRAAIGGVAVMGAPTKGLLAGGVAAAALEAQRLGLAWGA